MLRMTQLRNRPTVRLFRTDRGQLRIIRGDKSFRFYTMEPCRLELAKIRAKAV